MSTRPSTRRPRLSSATANTQGRILSPPNIQGPAGGNSNGIVNIFNQQVAGGVTHIFNQNSILDARFALPAPMAARAPMAPDLPSLMAGIPGLPTDPAVVRSLNVQSVNAYSQFGNQGSNPQFQNPTVYNPKINYTLHRGRSTYKVGYEYQVDLHRRSTTSIPSTARILITAASVTPALLRQTLSASDTGTKEAVALADFLFGARTRYQLNNFVIVHLNQRMHYMYLQDDIRVNSRLTVNAGLRYELVTPQWESNNLLSNYDPGSAVAHSGQWWLALQPRPGQHAEAGLRATLWLAYSMDPKTVIRAGYGISYAQFNREGGENLLVYNLPEYRQYKREPDSEQRQPRHHRHGSNAIPFAPRRRLGAAYNPANPTPCFRTTHSGLSDVASPALPS